MSNEQSIRQLLPVCATAVITIIFGTTSYFIASQDERIERNLSKIEEIRNGQHSIRERLKAIETDTGYIKRDVGETKEGIRDIQRTLRESLPPRER